MNEQLTKIEKIRRLPWMLAFSVFNSVFCVLTIFGSVFILFMDELGLDKVRIGVVLSLLPFAGLLALVIAPAVARFGLKRTFLVFWTLRKAVMALLLLSPWILSRYGEDVTFVFVAAVVLAFAVCRAVAETADYPWLQEVIPDSIRGKFGAVNTMVGTLAVLVALGAASYTIGRSESLNRFVVLIGVGVAAGLLSAWARWFVPGGAPVREGQSETAHFKAMRASLSDRNFLVFLLGVGAVFLGTVSVGSFIPLYLKQQVGLPAGKVVLLEIGTYSGMLVSSFLWGWAADRYGSKPVMLTGLSGVLPFPIFWFMIPRHSELSFPIAATIAFVGGCVATAWIMGMNRYLYVSAVPGEQKTAYMAVYYAWFGLMTGLAPLFSGWLLHFCNGIGGRVSIFVIDPFTPLFAAGFALTFVGLAFLRRVRSDGALPTSRFLGMFFRGNPLMAFGSMVRYRWAKDEPARVFSTERMGRAKNPLSSKELIESLNDPSFNVRYEAIISISRMWPDPQLVDALVGVLGGGEPDLSVAAAWALGRLGDRSAIVPLRETLLSEYPLLRARSARALATLGDRDSAGFILDQFRAESDVGVKVAYAAALGMLKASDATDDLLAFLYSLRDEHSREEVSLALARIAGREDRYMKLWRAMREETGTATAQALLGIRKNLKRPGRLVQLDGRLQRCADAFARDDLRSGCARLAELLRHVPAEKLSPPSSRIVMECARRLEEFGPDRREYVLLALHALRSGAV